MELFERAYDFRRLCFSLLSFLLITVCYTQCKSKLPSGDPDNGGLFLPEGFEAVVVVDSLKGRARHLAVNNNSDIYARLSFPDLLGGNAAFHNTDNDGKADIIKVRNSKYTVKKLKGVMKINGDWNKPQWQSVKAVYLAHYMGQMPSFCPSVHVKMVYDEKNLYVIFKVNDRYVRSIVEEYNGPVSSDACVEFFFSPDIKFPERYFNLEINAGGFPFMAYHIYGQKKYQKFLLEDLKKIEIAHSLPNKVYPEITTPVIWTIEYKLPVSILNKYGSVTNPASGDIWYANFYKAASDGPNPHYLAWSPVNNLKPNFHLPQFFGTLEFEK